MAEHDDWRAELRRIFDESFHFDWTDHLAGLNARLNLQDDPFQVSIPGLPPCLFNGDVEAITPGDWTLVISLNHQLSEKHRVLDQPQAWDFWRNHNRDHWYPRFFRPLVQVASVALGHTVSPDAESDYATRNMIFVELCPYASRWFRLSPEQVADLVASDDGVRTAHEVIDLLVDRAEPALVLLNGNATGDTFEAIYRGRLTHWEDIRYVSSYNDSRMLRHKQGYLDGFPTAGFPFLRTMSGHNANIEIRQLGQQIQDFING